MKLFLYIVLFCCPIAAFCQIETDTPKKKDNAIKVIRDTSVNTKFLKLALLNNGFGIEKEDVETGYIQSTEKAMSSYSVKIRLIISDSSVVITGQVANDVTLSIGGIKIERTFEQISNSGMKGSDIRKGWDILVDFANQIPGRKIYYQSPYR